MAVELAETENFKESLFLVQTLCSVAQTAQRGSRIRAHPLGQRWGRAKGTWELVFRWCNIPMISLLQEFTNSSILAYVPKALCTLYHTARGIGIPLALVQASKFRYSRSCRPSVYSNWRASDVPSLRLYLKLCGRTRLTCIVGPFTQ